MSKFDDKSPRLVNDPGAIGASLALFPDQLVSAWRQLRPIRLPSAYRQVASIAVCGMGGSHLGADIIRSVFADQLRIPMTIIAEYVLPGWVDRHTLVIVSSYSGGTEESLAALQAARARHAKIVVLTAGGKLASAARRWRLPLLQYNPRENPSRQPRLGVAYSLVAVLQALTSARLISITPDMRRTMVWTAREAVRRFGPGVPTKKNTAKILASRLAGRIPLLIGGEWTIGNLQTWTNQVHENAKTLAIFDVLPDLNHHLLEGLRDRRVTVRLAPVMIRDRAYQPKINRRLQITASILTKLGARPEFVAVRAESNLDKAIELLAFGGYVSWYLSIMNDVDPAPIPTVDELKRRLATA